MKLFFSTATVLLFVVVFFGIAFQQKALAGPTDCKPGYEWKPRSGVGCVQKNCSDVPDAHWGYTQNCVCGTSGSIHEKDTDPNKECHYPADHKSCPSCVYACVHNDDECPGEKKGEKETKQDTKKDGAKDTKKNTPATATPNTPSLSTAALTIKPTLTTKATNKCNNNTDCTKDTSEAGACASPSSN